MSVETQGDPAARRFRLPLVILLVAASLFLAWSAFWYVAAGKTATVLDAWMAHERAVGRVWTCPDRKIGGYPFAIGIACTNPRFEGDFAGRHIIGSLEGFTATAWLYNPGRVIAGLAAPLVVHSTDGAALVTLRWTSLQLDMSGLPKGVSHIGIRASDIAVQGAIPDVGAIAGHVATLTAEAQKATDRQDQAYAFRVTGNGGTIPVVDTWLGGTLPTAFDLGGTMTQADFSSPGTLAARIDHWRQAGGRVDLSDAILTRGTARFDARGTLALDAMHRLHGRLDAQFAGLERILLRLGVNPNVVSVGTLLGGLFGGAPRAGHAGGGGLRLPVIFDQGIVAIGPVRTSLRLAPLY